MLRLKVLCAAALADFFFLVLHRGHEVHHAAMVLLSLRRIQIESSLNLRSSQLANPLSGRTVSASIGGGPLCGLSDSLRKRPDAARRRAQPFHPTGRGIPE